MRKLVKKYKLVVAVLFLGLVVFFLSRGVKRPALTPSPTPTLPPFVVERFFPPQGEKEIVIPNFAPSFTFSNQMDTKNLNVLVVPFTGFEFSTDSAGKTLYVSPTTPWEFDTEYKITIQVKDVYGQALKEPFVYVFTPKKVTTSDLPGEH